MKKSKIKVHTSDVVKTFIWILIMIYAISIIALYGWVLLSSFKGKIDFNTNIFGFPKKIIVENYSKALTNFMVPIFRNGRVEKVYLGELLTNSLFYIIGCSISATICPIMVSYATSKFNFKFNALIDGIVIVTMILPIIGSDAAMIKMSQRLGLYDHMVGMYFMKFTFLGFNYLLFKSTFKSIDKAYAESAYIDGASEFRIMTSINLPLIANVFAIVLLIQLMGFWADWTTPLIYMPHKPTVAYALYELQFSSDPVLAFKPVQFAACILASIPTLIIYISFRKKIMGGLSIGGLK